jgi:hypothetical protein
VAWHWNRVVFWPVRPCAGPIGTGCGPALLASQCATLEPPGAEEGALALRAFRPVGQMVAEARNWLKL